MFAKRVDCSEMNKRKLDWENAAMCLTGWKSKCTETALLLALCCIIIRSLHFFRFRCSFRSPQINSQCMCIKMRTLCLREIPIWSLLVWSNYNEWVIITFRFDFNEEAQRSIGVNHLNPINGLYPDISLWNGLVRVKGLYKRGKKLIELHMERRQWQPCAPICSCYSSWPQQTIVLKTLSTSQSAYFPSVTMKSIGTTSFRSFIAVDAVAVDVVGVVVEIVFPILYRVVVAEWCTCRAVTKNHQRTR